MISILITTALTAWIVRAHYKLQAAEARPTPEPLGGKLLEDRRRAIETHFGAANLAPPNTLEPEKNRSSLYVRGVSLNGVDVGRAYSYNISEGWVDVYDLDNLEGPSRRYGDVEVDFDYVAFMLDCPSDFLNMFAPKGSATPLVNN
jgi:hypothetical protein